MALSAARSSTWGAFASATRCCRSGRHCAAAGRTDQQQVMPVGRGHLQRPLHMGRPLHVYGGARGFGTLQPFYSYRLIRPTTANMHFFRLYDKEAGGRFGHRLA